MFLNDCILAVFYLGKGCSMDPYVDANVAKNLLIESVKYAETLSTLFMRLSTKEQRIKLQ